MLFQKLLAMAATPIQVVSGINGSTLVSGVTSVTFSGHQQGDWLVAFGGGQGASEPTITAGWTRLTGTFNGGGSSFRGFAAAYLIAPSSSNQSITFTSSGSSSLVYSSGLIVRGVSGVGAIGLNSVGTVGATVDVPALALQQTNGSSLVVCGVYAEAITAISGSPAMTLFPDPTPFQGGYLLGATSFPSRTMTATGSITNIAASIELLN